MRFHHEKSPLELRFRVPIKLFLLMFSCALFACSHPISHRENPATTSPDASTVVNDVKQKIKIKTPDEKPVAEFDLTGSNPKIDFSLNGRNGSLRGKSNEKGKRKYEADDNRVVAELKADADTFKLKAADGRLLWKIKFVDSKVKIANNEEMNNAFVLKPGETDRVKILRDETEIGKVKFYRDRGKVKVDNTADVAQYESNTNVFSGAYGVMLMNDIPEAERLIIIAELLARGR